MKQHQPQKKEWDKRPWEIICRDKGHWDRFFAWKNVTPSTSNVVKIKERSQ